MRAYEYPTQWSYYCPAPCGKKTRRGRHGRNWTCRNPYCDNHVDSRDQRYCSDWCKQDTRPCGRAGCTAIGPHRHVIIAVCENGDHPIYRPAHPADKGRFCSKWCAKNYDDRQRNKARAERARAARNGHDFRATNEHRRHSKRLCIDGALPDLMWASRNRCANRVCRTLFDLRNPNGNAYPTVDHIIPLVEGGSNHRSNLQALCRQCNSRKQATITATQMQIEM